MTIKLFGVPASNFYNVAKAAFLLKGIAFEEVALDPAAKTETFLAMSPMGKVPCMETDQGVMSESLAIALYAERLQPEPALFPSDAAAAGRALQIHQLINLYVFQHTVKLIGPCFFGKEATPAFIDETLAAASNALQAAAKVFVFDPYIAGKNLTIADLTALFELDLLHRCSELAGRPSPVAAVEGWSTWRAHVSQNEQIAATLTARNHMWEQLLAGAVKA